MPEASWTRHATDRLIERVSLSPAEICRLIDTECCVLIGQERGTRRIHWLFYSDPNSNWFVAVQDERSGEVVTILPVDWHNRWEISPEALERAKQLALGEPENRLDLKPDASAGSSPVREAKAYYHLFFFVRRRRGGGRGAVRKFGLGRVPVEQWGNQNLEQLATNSVVLQYIQQRLVSWPRNGHRLPQCVYISRGPNGTRIEVLLLRGC